MQVKIKLNLKQKLTINVISNELVCLFSDSFNMETEFSLPCAVFPEEQRTNPTSDIYIVVEDAVIDKVFQIHFYLLGKGYVFGSVG